MLEFYWICCKFYGIILSTIVQNFIYTRLLTKKLQTIIHLIKLKITCKKIHFNVLSFINEFYLLHKYLLEFYLTCCKYCGITLATIVQNFINIRVLTKKLQTTILLIKHQISCKKKVQFSFFILTWIQFTS